MFSVLNIVLRGSIHALDVKRIDVSIKLNNMNNFYKSLFRTLSAYDYAILPMTGSSICIRYFYCHILKIKRQSGYV